MASCFVRVKLDLFFHCRLCTAERPGADVGRLGADRVPGTYDSLRAKNKQSESRLDQLIAWAAAATDDDREAFSGCLIFDEAHKAKNLVPAKGETAQKGSKTAEAVLDIQRR